MKYDYQIRLAAPDDLPALTSIYDQAVRTGRSTGDLETPDEEHQRRWLHAHHADRDPVYVASCAGRVVGYNALSLYRGGRGAFRRTRETSYYVDSDWHRRGVASRLMEHVLAECRRLQLRSLITFVLAHNEASLAFLHKQGFRLWGSLPDIAEIGGCRYDHLILGRRVQGAGTSQSGG